ncbi:phytanoyl-CoA dioxygenase family protein [Fulvivirgaceae bacterium PWU4]|uniref:Phytanoyl-CoA dioxygenase family protein n=1 Tax=Chryseosolibacter histidini TaxID=2782349 RepID=A0AAP2GJ80_9BACT|nr:phytanoyl-CoA dioxygenase family protein [Chryseosolibacter histidini]MBT1698061.1 phytanoyl-CoA dioxygenase family protein [Chryseosolibacter histidini]
MTDLTSAIAETHQQGFAVVQQYFTTQTLDDLLREYDRIETGAPSMDNLLNRSDVVRDMAFEPRILNLVKSVIGGAAIPVTAFFLNKTQDNNWTLPWHQDIKVAVDSFAEAEGYSGWTNESGILHVIPPPRFLDKMLSVRFNLDDSDDENGGLQVLPGTHQEGLLSNEDLDHKVKTIAPLLCVSPAGSITLLKALTVHRSEASRTLRNRRILQIEYCGERLHDSLKFYDLGRDLSRQTTAL